MIHDPFSKSVDSPTAPSRYCFTVVPDDVSLLPRATKAIYIGDEGDVTLLSVGGDQDVIFRNVPAGSILDVCVQAVRATGTTASSIIGLS